MKNLVIVLIAALLVVLTLAATWYFTAVYPWVRAPSGDPAARATDWAELTAYASLDDVAQGDPARLIKAELAVERRLTELQELTGRAADGPLPTLRDADLPEEARVAMREALDWAAAGGGLGAAACGDELEAMPLVTLGRLLLATSRDARAPEIDAVLRMAAALRASGDLAQVTVGFHLSDDIRRWVEERHVRPGSAFATWRPSMSEVPLAVAREAACVYRDAERDLAGDHFAAWLGGLSEDDGGPALGRQQVTLARELAAWQAYAIPRVAAAREANGDAHALRKATRLPSSRQDRPASALVRTHAYDVSAQIDRWDQIARAYDAMVERYRLAR